MHKSASTAYGRNSRTIFTTTTYEEEVVYSKFVCRNSNIRFVVTRHKEVDAKTVIIQPLLKPLSGKRVIGLLPPEKIER